MCVADQWAYASPDEYRSMDTEDEAHDRGEEGICSECGFPAVAVRMDMGYGAYEYWGARGTHHDWQWLSPCCEADVVPGDCKLVREARPIANKEYRVYNRLSDKPDEILPGEQYKLSVYRHYKSGRGSWYSQTREKLHV